MEIKFSEQFIKTLEVVNVVEFAFRELDRQISEQVIYFLKDYCSFNNINPNDINQKITCDIDKDNNTRIYFDGITPIIAVKYDMKDFKATIIPAFMEDIMIHIPKAVL